MNLLQKFKNIDQNHKSLIFLNWIYTIWSIIAGIFTSFYVYKTFWNSVEMLLYYAILYYTTTFIGFSVIWAIFAKYKKDIKNLYYLSYVLFFFAFISIFLSIFSFYFIFVFSTFYWLWNGAFRCAVHTQELAHIEDKARDKYSSIISSGDNLLKFIIPLFISVLFAFSLYLHFNWYIILFLIMPLIYLFSFRYINAIRSYIPKSKITKDDVLNFFSFKYFYILLYFFSVWFYQWLGNAGIITILFLKNEINIGLFQWIMSILATFIVIFLVKKRKIENRQKIFLYTTLFNIINIIIFMFNLSIYWFIIYSLIWLLIAPIYRVSEHVYNLRFMDFIKHWESDFFPAMILREVLLLAWRLSPIIALLVRFTLFKLNPNTIIIFIFTSVIIGQILAFASVYLFNTKKHNL